MKLYTLLAATLATFVLTFPGCESTHRMGSSDGLSVTGKVGEILVVCENAIWESEIKECLDTNLTQWIMPYFPDVATFTLVHKTKNHFTQGVKRWRNTIFLKIDPNHQGEKGKIERREDVWAKGQLVIDIIGKDFNQLEQTCKYGLANVHDEFDTFEWKRLIKRFEKTPTKQSRKKIQDNFGVDIVLPSNAKIVTKRKNFYRIEFPPSSRPIEFVNAGSTDAGQIFSGMMIYQYDFIDSAQLELDQLLRDRDTMLKYNVPHEIDGLYMGTQYDPRIYPEEEKITNMDGSVKGVDVRGMFYFTGRDIHSTGGAFWEFHFVNPNTKKLITLSGYVDAPPTASWTHPLREVQAILRSVEIPE